MLGPLSEPPQEPIFDKPSVEFGQCMTLKTLKADRQDARIIFLYTYTDYFN